jgi:hypothetical protein
MAVELNHTIVPAHDPRVSAQFLRDPNGHLMEILTPIQGEPA